MHADPPASWPRPKYTAGGGNPRLFYKIQGQFAQGAQLSPHRYGSAGVPAGCALQSYDRQRHADVLALGLDEAAGAHLRQQGIFDKIATAPQCLVLRGGVADPSTFDYFRDAIGVILAALDLGGVAVFDPLLQVWWTAEHWRSVALAAKGFAPKLHTLILVTEDEDRSLRWVHTRGMVKFGRPDISAHDVPLELVPAFQELCEMLVETLAFGTVVRDRQEIQTQRLPGAWECRYEGHSNDPEFNNVHLEVRRLS